MSTKSLKLLGWSSRGLRCPDYNVDFTRNGKECFKVSLIQMPNGTGKTTTLNLLRAALSGKSPNGGEWAKYDIKELAKPGYNSAGEFIVHFLHADRKYSVRLAFDFYENDVGVFTTGPSGEESGFNPPRALEQFLNPNFVRFFVFDGELANELKDDTKQNAEQAIDALFQFNCFKWMGEWANSYLNDRISQQSEAGAGGASTEKGLKKKQNLVSRLSVRINDLEEMQAKLAQKHTDAKSAMTDLENKSKAVIESKSELAERMRLAKDQEKQAELSLQKSTADLIDSMRDPQQLSPQYARQLDELRISFDRVKLPENTAREWFEELAEEELCICGRSLGDDERIQIRERSKKYLGSGDVAFLNQLKGEISSRVQEPFEEADLHVRELITETRSASDAYGRAKQKVAEITKEAAESDPEVDRAVKKITELRENIFRYTEELRKFKARDNATRPEDCFNISELKRQLKTEQQHVDRLAKTVQLRWKCEHLKELLNTVYSDAVRRMGEALAITINESLDNLMPDNAVRLEGVEKSLRFKKKAGASVGETLTVAYAFLTHLTARSQFDMPLVIDTPAAPVDEHIREEVGKCLPQMVSQFIAFTISPERGSFTTALSESASGDIQYVTLFRKSNSRLMHSITKSTKREETDDAVLITGQKYFDRFQDDSEYHRPQSKEGKTDV